MPALYSNKHACELQDYIETLILNGFSLMIWPTTRFVKFVKVSWYTVVMQVSLKPGFDEGELRTESSSELYDVQRFHCQKSVQLKE